MLLKRIRSGVLLASLGTFLLAAGAVSALAAERLSVKKGTVNVRSGPGTEYEILWEAEANYPVEVLATEGKWVRFRDYEDYQGWLYRPLLDKTDTVVVKRSGKSNVRSGPGTKNPVVFVVQKGVPFRVLERRGNWLRVRHADGDKGWIHKSLVW